MGGLCESTDMSLIFVGDNSTDYMELGSYECRMRCLAAARCVGFNLAINYKKNYLFKLILIGICTSYVS